MKEFLLCFIPLFVAFDVLGVLPMFINLSRSATSATRQRMVIQALITAFVVSLVLIAAGNAIFSFLGISLSDLKIAGGLILLILSIHDLTRTHDPDSRTPYEPGQFGVVPLGIPMILGPAAITTLMVSSDAYGWKITIAALLSNLVIVALGLLNASRIEKVLTKNGAAAFGKIAALFLAAIAVMMIRSGLGEVFPSLLMQK